MEKYKMINEVLQGYPDKDSVEDVLDYAKSLEDSGFTADSPISGNAREVIVDTNTGETPESLFVDTSGGNIWLSVVGEHPFEVYDSNRKFDVNNCVVDFGGTLVTLSSKNKAWKFFKIGGAWKYTKIGTGKLQTV
jgi:hypothetical protein